MSSSSFTLLSFLRYGKRKSSFSSFFVLRIVTFTGRVNDISIGVRAIFEGPSTLENSSYYGGSFAYPTAKAYGSITYPSRTVVMASGILGSGIAYRNVTGTAVA